MSDQERLERMRHSAAHVMAQAVSEIFPGTRFGVGPVIEDGFYYDFDPPETISEDDLPRIEKAMRRIVKRGLPIERRVLARSEAEEIFREDPYKMELLDAIDPGEEVSIYTQGSFTDLCRGPHLEKTSGIGPFKLMKTAGAYWRGDERNKMLVRIYGTAWETKEDLDAYIERLKEAKRRDHRVLGRELDLFSISENVGGGLVLWHPRGATVRRIIEDYWMKRHLDDGYEIVRTPHIGKADLWRRSGHLDFFRDSMYAPMDLDGSEYFVKPMNCPFHIEIYRTRTRSYRDLPMRWAELGTVYRFEKSGVLHGLLRVRGFTQDDAHIYCAPSDVENEIRRVVRFCLDMLRTFGFEEFECYVSTKPEEKSVGSDEDWDRATKALMAAASAEGLEYRLDEGGGAFYGPKIDLKIKDALGRAWQCSTVQFDFNLPERFGIEYIGPEGRPERPFMVHRALLGSIERFFGCLIEHYAGAFPVWLAPVQARVLSITERTEEYARSAAGILKEEGIRADADLGSEKIGKKIRIGEKEKIPYMLVVGDREAEAGTVAVRRRGEGEMGAMPLAEFIALIKGEIAERT